MKPATFVKATVRCLLLAGFTFFTASISAQSPGVGTIEGRVLNPATGEYLELVRITVEGTALETFTDSSGHYRLGNVPAGPASVKAFRTGIPLQTQSVRVVAGETVQQDFALSSLQPKPPADGTIRLEEFVVADSKEMDGAGSRSTRSVSRRMSCTSWQPTSSAPSPAATWAKS